MSASKASIKCIITRVHKITNKSGCCVCGNMCYMLTYLAHAIAI